MTELLGCPFCGGEAIRCGNNDLNPRHWVMCRDCHACPGGDVPDLDAAETAWNRRALSATQEQVPVEVATVSDHNAAFDPANDAFGGAFKDGFREGWLFAQDPGFEDREDLEADYSRTVDIAPSECWDAYRSHYFSMLPLASIPEVGSALVASTPPAPVSSETVEVSECAEKIDGMLRKLEALRIAFDMKGANATTILRVVNTLATMKSTLVTALTPAQPLPVQEAVAEIIAPVSPVVAKLVGYDINFLKGNIPIGSKLYLHPAPSSAGVVGEWQPISKADKAAGEIVYLNRFGEIGFCEWYEGGDDEQDCWWDPHTDNEAIPVWWMPRAAIPAAPQPKQEGE